MTITSRIQADLGRESEHAERAVVESAVVVCFAVAHWVLLSLDCASSHCGDTMDQVITAQPTIMGVTTNGYIQFLNSKVIESGVITTVQNKLNRR
ncbi:MAG: hypothetical protein O3C43_15190 [Verrucomicrobia bacterium]|nr:hypothetical protein [Verrucomicrobiota bacterium]MDA1067836.1 hypothetical protein [Verrucomicrobiota bacterium]